MSRAVKQVAIEGGFDAFDSAHVRLLDEASRLGELTVRLWTDEAVAEQTGKPPAFPFAERLYVIESSRYVARVVPQTRRGAWSDAPDSAAATPDVWVLGEGLDTAAPPAAAGSRKSAVHVVRQTELRRFPPPPAPLPPDPSRRRVIVTGCYDWFHSGHVRFFEEVSALGELLVVVGNDANVALLKGAGHPLFPQDERRYVVQSVRFVAQALVSTGTGWLDAEPEVRQLRPHVYAVNEDGDKPEKREFCAKHGLQYVVLRRTPKEGLARRTSTNLRGF